jgi:hypothetical protein
MQKGSEPDSRPALQLQLQQLQLQQVIQSDGQHAADSESNQPAPVQQQLQPTLADVQAQQTLQEQGGQAEDLQQNVAQAFWQSPGAALAEHLHRVHPPLPTPHWL